LTTSTTLPYHPGSDGEAIKRSDGENILIGSSNAETNRLGSNQSTTPTRTPDPLLHGAIPPLTALASASPHPLTRSLSFTGISQCDKENGGYCISFADLKAEVNDIVEDSSTTKKTTYEEKVKDEYIKDVVTQQRTSLGYNSTASLQGPQPEH
jgi:hypothetical protein